MASKMPNGDKWELIDNDGNSHWYGKKFKFDFSYIESNSIKNVVKAYIWRNYKENNKTLRKMYGEISEFKKFISFALINDITTLEQLTNSDIDNFMSYLKSKISNRTKQPLSYASQKNIFYALKAIIRWGQLYLIHEVPKGEIFTGNEYVGCGKKIKN